MLAEGPRHEIERRADRLAKAVADFDVATIETTHGFCLHVLVGLGVAGDVERDVTFVEDVRDLLDEVVDDLYIRRFWSDRTPPPFLQEGGGRHRPGRPRKPVGRDRAGTERRPQHPGHAGKARSQDQ